MSIVISLMACDSPQRTRNPYGVPLPAEISTSGNGILDTNPDSNIVDADPNVGTTTPTNITAGFDNCNLAYQYYNSFIGHFGICQSSQVDTQFKIKIAQADAVEGNCFVPTYIMPDGTSYKLGRAECVRNEADKEYDMTLSKERSETINGVMVIKYNALGPYMDCMNAKVNFLTAFPNYPEADANIYAANVCSQFVNTFRNYYIQVKL